MKAEENLLSNGALKENNFAIQQNVSYIPYKAFEPKNAKCTYENSMITMYMPNKVNINKIKFNGVKLYDKKIKEIRIYTDKAKTKICKIHYTAKINRQISERGELVFFNLPKRIRKQATNNIGIKFIF